jgi:hypothetical protein
MKVKKNWRRNKLKDVKSKIQWEPKPLIFGLSSKAAFIGVMSSRYNQLQHQSTDIK